MAVRPRNRFEVFKRDGFQCQYCGRRVPDVTLEVDHVVPRAEGGKDGRDNLITACVECNRGKGAVPLTEGVPSIDYASRAEDAKERAKQVSAWRKHEEVISEALEADLQSAIDCWVTMCQGTGYNLRGSLYRFVKGLGLASVKDAMNIACQNPRTKHFGYVIAILNNRMKERSCQSG